jgi:hypothetical protein
MRPAAAILALALAAPVAAAAQDVGVTVEGKTTVVSAARLATLPRATVSLPRKDGPKAFEGPVLSYILREAGAPGGAKMHGAVMKTYVVVTGADGFSAVLSLAEADKDFHAGTVILADQAAGAPLTGKEGPYRLVIEGDKKASRSVYGVTGIVLRTAD